MLTAKVVRLNAGYDYDKKRASEAGLVLGNEYQVEDVSMGQSHTSITLKDKGIFNSVFFEFYEDGKELDIYRDPRYNPYMSMF